MQVAYVYDPSGACVGTLTAMRLKILHDWYHGPTGASHRGRRSLGGFEEDVARLLRRYTPGFTDRGYTVTPAHHMGLHPSLHHQLTSSLGLVIDRYASPLEFDASCAAYHSPFLEDCVFG
jgi:hypothetical protein